MERKVNVNAFVIIMIHQIVYLLRILSLKKLCFLRITLKMLDCKVKGKK